MKNQQGFTLIETIVYLGLFSIIIGGGMVATYQIIQSTNTMHSKVIIQEDADFLLHKLEWGITGATSASATATSLTLVKSSGNLVFNVSNGNMNLNFAPLNSSFVSVAPASGVDVFSYDSATKKITIKFTVNGQLFSQTQYLY